MKRVRVYRRRLCIRLGHPMASWSPIVMSFKEDDYVVGGVLVPGQEYLTRAWRCARHDKEPA